MTQINQLDTATPALSDLVPFFSNSAGDSRATTFEQIGQLLEAAQTGAFITQYAAPNASGFSVQVVNPGLNTFLLLTPVAGYAAGTIVLPDPSGNVDGQEFLCVTTQSIASLTVLGGPTTAAPVNGEPTSLPQFGSFRLRWDAVLGSWYQVSSALSPAAAVQTYSWAQLSTVSAAANPYAYAQVSDWGGALFVSNGSYWRPASGQLLLYSRSNPTVDAITGTTSETEFTAAKYTVPAGLMQAGWGLAIEAHITNTSSATNSTYRIKYGGQTMLNPSAVGARTFRVLPSFNNAGSVAVQQITTGGLTNSTFGASTSAVGAGTVDTSASFALQFYAQPGAVGDTMALSWVRVVLIAP